MTANDHDRAATEPVSVLQGLRLTSVELQALARQGFVACESRGARGPYFKLRFRVGSNQVVRGLGWDADFAAEVQAAICELQQPRRRQLDMARLIAEAAQALRATKHTLREPLAELGLHFHGQAIRRTRVVRRTANPATNTDLIATT